MNNVCYCFAIGRERMAESVNDDNTVEEDEEDGVVETSKHLTNFSSKKQMEKRKTNLVGK